MKKRLIGQRSQRWRGAMAGITALPIGLITLLSAAAQDADTSASDEAQPPGVIRLDPVIVTGLRRVEDARDYAGSVTVVGGDNPVTEAIDPGAALTRQAPNFSFAGFGQPGSDFVNIRGIGILGQPSNSLDNTVGFSTNGAPTSALGYPPSLLDVQRVEIFRGPQGTLFGRNALGGLVNVVTTPADGTRDFRLKGELGTDNYRLVEAVAGDWLIPDVLAGRVAARYQRQDGDVANVVIGEDEGDIDVGAIRATLRFAPTDRLTVDTIVGYDRDVRRNNYTLYKEADDFPVSGADVMPRNDRRRWEGNLNIEHAFDYFKLTSLTNLQRIKLEGRNDVGDEVLFPDAFGFIPPRGADLSRNDDTETLFSQEFRLNSALGADISWVAGVSYLRSDFDSARDQDSSFSPYSSGLFDTDILSQSFAIFGDVTVPLTDKLKVSAGLRVAHDEQELNSSYTGKGFPGTVAAFSDAQERSDTYPTGRVAVSYDWTRDLTTYASVSRGYASGGFERFTLNNAVGEPTQAFDPSTIWAFEVGSKASLWNDRLDLSGAAFYNRVNDGQLVGFDINRAPVVFQFVNQDYETYGFEMEGRAAINDQLQVGAGFGLTFSELGDTTETAEFGAAEGNRVPNSSLFNAFVNVDYRITDFAYIGGQYAYVGDREADIANSYDLSDYHIFNARAGLRYQGFDLYVFGNNLFDERPLYFGVTYSDRVHAVAIGPGRTLGLGLAKTF